MRPDFKELNERAESLIRFDEMLQTMFSQTQQLKDAAAALCHEQQRRQSQNRLLRLH